MRLEGRSTPNGARTRVVHLVLDLEAGGLERVVADLVRRTDPARFELHVVAINFLGRYAQGLEDYASLHVAGPLSRWSLVWPQRLIRCLQAIEPDVVHIHSGAWYKGALAARRAGVPLVLYTDHGRRHPDPLFDRLQDRAASLWTDTVVAVSDTLSQQLEGIIAGTASSKLVTIPNGIDTESYRPRFDTGVLREQLSLSVSTPIIGSLGRIDHIKGFDVMVEAFALLNRDWTGHVAPVLVIAGDGPDRPELERLIDQRGLRGKAHVLGWRTDVHDLHSAFSLFTLSSRSEGTSISLLESMSAGLCPVVTNVGGNSAVLGDDLQHRLVPSERPDLLAIAWNEALCDEQRRQRDARCAQDRVCRKFSLSAMVHRYELLYAQRAVLPENAESRQVARA